MRAKLARCHELDLGSWRFGIDQFSDSPKLFRGRLADQADRQLSTGDADAADAFKRHQLRTAVAFSRAIIAESRGKSGVDCRLAASFASTPRSIEISF